jgi:hypothetical protein
MSILLARGNAVGLYQRGISFNLSCFNGYTD